MPKNYDALGMIRGSGDNLQVAIDGETYEIKETYPAFFAGAQLQEEKGAMQTLDAALQAEKIHANMNQKAKQTVETRKEIQLGTMYICDVCGYTVEGEAPDRCPI